MQVFESSTNNSTKTPPPLRWTKHHIWGRLSLCLLSTWIFCLVSLHDYSILLHPPQSDFGFAPPSRRRVTAAAGENQRSSNSSNSSSAPWNSTAGLVVVVAAGADLPEPNHPGPPAQHAQIFQTRPQQARRSVKEQHVLEKPYKENNSNQYDSKPRNKKKHLIFHVGPSKTATTFLQTELTKLVQELKQDHYLYTGRFYYPKVGRKEPTNGNPSSIQQWSRDWTRLHHVARQMLKRKHCKQTILPRSQCLNEFRSELTQLNDDKDTTTTLQKNILLSDESWGPQSWKTTEDYQALQELATNLGYELTIVVGYRPFFEWIRSDLFQRHRLDTLGKSQKKTAWPDGTSSNSTAQVMPWLFPDYFRRSVWHDQHIHRFTDFVVENARDYVDHFHILNLHNPSNESLVTQLACRVLPDAPTTCRKSQETNYSSSSMGNHNAQSSQHSSSRTILHHHHDLVATQAAALGLIDTNRYTRQRVRESLRDFMQDTLGQSPVVDYPIQCPTQQQLDEFLAESLQLEEVCLGKEGAAQQEEHTRALFQKYVQDGSFCIVDPVAALNHANWPYAGFLETNFGFGNGTLS